MAATSRREREHGHEDQSVLRCVPIREAGGCRSRGAARTDPDVRPDSTRLLVVTVRQFVAPPRGFLSRPEVGDLDCVPGMKCPIIPNTCGKASLYAIRRGRLGKRGFRQQRLNRRAGASLIASRQGSEMLQRRLCGSSCGAFRSEPCVSPLHLNGERRRDDPFDKTH